MTWEDDTEDESPLKRYQQPFWCEPCGAAIYSEDMYTHAHRHMDKGADVDAVMRHFDKL